MQMPNDAVLLERLPRPEPSWFQRPDGDDGSSGIHGVSHTTRVLIHALELAQELDIAGWEREALALAALWHDIGRIDNGADYYRGAKSAGKVVGLGLHRGLDQLVVETALYAVTHHSGSEEHAERGVQWLSAPDSALRVFRLLKDSDGLDRVRLGTHGDLDVRYLRYDVSRLRVERAWELLRLVPR
jgi:hypothetical protein